MAYRVIYLPLAELDIMQLADALAGYHKKTPIWFLSELEKRMASLADHPLMVEQYEYNPSFRKLIVADYLVFYKVDDEATVVRIYRVLHGESNVRSVMERHQEV